MDVIKVLYEAYLESYGTLDTAVERRASWLSGNVEGKLCIKTLSTTDLADLEEAARCAGFHGGYSAGFKAAVAAINAGG